jgi:ATP-dependent DNA helicase RecQ
VTATATPAAIIELTKVLDYENPSVIKSNPDRPNIYIDVRKRLPNNKKFDKFNDMIEPIVTQLKSKLLDFPVTVVYAESLEAVGYFYQYTSGKLGNLQYAGTECPENRIFAQYHTDYSANMKTHILKELRELNPKIRLVFATVALGMGVNAPSITQIIHCRPPTTLEKYMQEIGRAGRLGQKATAILYYNESDIAKNRKGLSSAVTKFCKNNGTCFRLELLNYFGFDRCQFEGPKEECCSNCKSLS